MDSTDRQDATVSFGRGTWSFYEFLQVRNKSLHELRGYLAECCGGRRVASELPNARTTIYVGPGISRWLTDSPRNVIWLTAAPVMGDPIYPVVLDVMDSAKALEPNGLISAASAALAPTWEELGLHGLTAAFSGPRWDDVQGGDDDILERFLLSASARAIASLGPGFGVVLRGPQRYDHASTVFVERLLREARQSGFHVALEAPISLVLDPRYREQLRDANVIKEVDEPKRRRLIRSEPDETDPATTVLALCPHGAPARLLDQFGAVRPDWGLCDGPAGERWAFLEPAKSRAIRARLSFSTRQRLLAQLYDTWNPNGWGYLRRAGMAIAARDSLRILAQHTPYNYGLADIGRDFLYRQFVSLSRFICKATEDLPSARYAAVGAARLASRVRRVGGLSAALRHYQRALRLTQDPAVQADLIYAIANLYAHQGNPSGLCQSRRWYQRGYEVLGRIYNPENKSYLQIRLANGLALVAYREGRDDEALALEQRARSVALSAKSDYPEVERWATPIINRNTAKLLAKRSADLPGAIKLLEENISASDPLVREHARIELARLYFDQGSHQRVVELLDPLYDQAQPTDFDEQQELFGRLMFSFALLIVKDTTRAQRQLPRLIYLLHAIDTPGARQFLASIKQAAEEYGVAV